MPLAAVSRQPFYFPDGRAWLAGWLHACDATEARDLVAVICPAIGPENSRGYRAVRHLADALARQGVPALRFEYEGCGNSTGSELDPDRIPRWIDNIAAAVRRARALTGRTRVCLVGLRFGGALAALATAVEAADLLVLWNTPSKGSRYLRELQAIAAMGEEGIPTPGLIEAAGSMVTTQTAEAVKRISLDDAPLHAREVLLVHRGDEGVDAALPARLARDRVPFTEMSSPGWSDMVADQHLSAIPVAAVEEMAQWVSARGAAFPAPASPPPAELPDTMRCVHGLGPEDVEIEERLVNFGPAQRMFGVLSTRPGGLAATAVALFNAGSVQHVGPNRLYVDLCRDLAARGYAALRLDLRGLGDSIDPDVQENHPYPATAVGDALETLRYLRGLGYASIVASGLCSGAHTAFHVAIDPASEGVAGALLLNPLTYAWREGMSTAVSRRYMQVRGYRTSAFNPSRWKDVFAGRVNLKRPLAAMARHGSAAVRSYANIGLEMFAPMFASRLARNLRGVLSQHRGIALLVSESDPGYQMLRDEARWTVHRARKAMRLTVDTVRDADHTFSTHAVRLVVRDRIPRLLEGLLRGRTPPA